MRKKVNKNISFIEIWNYVRCKRDDEISYPSLLWFGMTEYKNTKKRGKKNTKEEEEKFSFLKYSQFGKY